MRRIKALEDAVAELAAANTAAVLAAGRTVLPDNVRWKLDSTVLATSWALMTNVAVSAVPRGYTRAQITLYSSTGATFNGSTGTGYVGSQAQVRYAATTAANDPISNGVPGATAVSAVTNSGILLSGLNGGQLAFDVWAYASPSGTLTVAAGSGNIHLSAQILYLR